MSDSPYNTLEEILQRKTELEQILHQRGEQIESLWHDLFTPKEVNSKGEMIASLISNSITAIDAFLLVRKLFKSYGYLFGRKKR